MLRERLSSRLGLEPLRGGLAAGNLIPCHIHPPEGGCESSGHFKGPNLQAVQLLLRLGSQEALPLAWPDCSFPRSSMEGGERLLCKSPLPMFRKDMQGAQWSLKWQDENLCTGGGREL